MDANIPDILRLSDHTNAEHPFRFSLQVFFAKLRHSEGKLLDLRPNRAFQKTQQIGIEPRFDETKFIYNCRQGLKSQWVRIKVLINNQT